MTQPPDSKRLESYIVDLYGGDPFDHIRRASDEHRETHGPDCGAFPSGPIKMRLMSTLIHASSAKRILEIGCGLGYSALWLAEAAGPDGRVDAIDRFAEHATLAQQFAAEAGLSDRLNVIEREAADALPALTGPYDFVHDDGWFAAEPPYLERMIDLTRPGGLLALSNWFLLEDAVTDKPQMDWAQFAGPDWAEQIQAYARRLASHPRLRLSFALRPWLGLAVKTE